MTDDITPTNGNTFNQGDHVRHPRLGTGVVLAQKDERLVIQFDEKHRTPDDENYGAPDVLFPFALERLEVELEAA